MIYRVFAPTDAEPKPGPLVEHLHLNFCPVIPHFRGDDLGWTSASLVLPGRGTPVQVDRYLTEADKLRPDLNRFAAELETLTYSPHHGPLMQTVIQTQQLIALRQPIDHADDALLETLCLTLTRYLATLLGGIYQIDTQGWFSAGGELLVQEY